MPLIAFKRGYTAPIGALLSILVLLGMAAPMFSPAASSPLFNTSWNMSLTPGLAALASSTPQSSVQVLIRTNGANTPEVAAVSRLGGRVLGLAPRLHLIDASVPAGALQQLASSHNVRGITLNAPMVSDSLGNTDKGVNSDYTVATQATQAWSHGYTGQGVSVAVLDSGIDAGLSDFGYRISSTSINTFGATPTSTLPSSGGDQYGHGTHVAGIIAGGGDYFGNYKGMAPGARLVDVHVSGPTGTTTEFDVILGIFWVLDHLNINSGAPIQVLNISMSSSVAQSYLSDPLDAAVEMAWADGVTVVVAAGNRGPNSVLYAPANDPYVITVGAINDNGSAKTDQYATAPFSSYGTTQDGFTKPDLMAPGMHIVSTMNSGANIAQGTPSSVIGSHYFRMSGTSMAAPVVAGAAALLLQAQPNLTPDQVKEVLMLSAQGLGAPNTGKGLLNANAMLGKHPDDHATQSYAHSNGLDNVTFQSTSGSGTVAWSTVAWSTVAWSTVAWSTVAWSTAATSTVAWSTGAESTSNADLTN